MVVPSFSQSILPDHARCVHRTDTLNGNRENTGYSTGTNNRLAQAPAEGGGTWTYTHDNEGNATKKSKGTLDTTWTYGYDHLNRLVQVKKANTDGGAAVLQVDYKYDVFGNRIERSYDPDGDGGTAATIERHAYDGENAWADLNSSDQLVTRRLYLDAVDSVFARIASSTPAWYLTDRLGSVRELIDNSATLLDRIEYEGFAKHTETSPSNGDRYKWTGREYDVEAELQYNRARYYDYRVGRWLSEDPIGFDAGDSNLYRYVRNEPTIRTDPRGLESIRIEFYPLVGTEVKTLQINDAVKKEVNRIFQDAVKRFGRKGDEVFITWVKTDAKDYDVRRQPGKEQSFGWTKSVGLGWTKSARGEKGRAIRIGIKEFTRSLAGAGIVGEKIADYELALYREGILRASDLLDFPAGKKNFDLAVATIIAHEAGLHIIGGKGDFHFSEKGFVDSRIGAVGGVFSKEAGTLIIEKLFGRTPQPLLPPFVPLIS